MRLVGVLGEEAEPAGVLPRPGEPLAEAPHRVRGQTREQIGEVRFDVDSEPFRSKRRSVTPATPSFPDAARCAGAHSGNIPTPIP